MVRPRRMGFMLPAIRQARHVNGFAAHSRRLMKTYDSDKTRTTLRQHIASSHDHEQVTEAIDLA